MNKLADREESLASIKEEKYQQEKDLQNKVAECISLKEEILSKRAIITVRSPQIISLLDL